MGPRKIHLFLLMLIIMSFNLVRASQGQCDISDKQFLTTFHPHLDAFWLNYDTQLKDIKFVPAQFLYAMNQRNSKTIFNSMLDALSKNSRRKYFITEVVFLKDWYEYLGESERKKVKELMEYNQLEVSNGGWVENDEAVCYFDDILDQYTIGHEFLNSAFGYQVKIGWATDSFGHSHSQAALEHLLGIQFQGIQRVDDRYVNEHYDKSLLQFFWSPFSDSNNRTYGGLLNHVRHFLHEVNDLRRTPLESLKADFVEIEERMRKVYHKDKVFRFLGNDFEQFIAEEFENLEKAFDELNSKEDSVCTHYKYGNPLDYLSMITKYYAQNQLPVRKYDLMPNWDQDRYWVGYFTTDPLLKKACKDFSRLVNFYRKILVIQHQNNQPKGQILETADELLSVIQHHDGITATSKTYIEEDLRKKMDKSNSAILKHIKQILKITQNDQFTCQLFKTNYQCKFNADWINSKKTLKFSIVSTGVVKSQKIQLIQLPPKKYYEVQGMSSTIFCDESNCRLVFDAKLFPGINEFTINERQESDVADSIVKMQKIDTAQDARFQGQNFSVQVIKESKQIVYKYGNNQFMKFGFYCSPNKGASRETKSWDKYGNKNQNTQHVTPGMYIMLNTGQLQPFGHQFSEIIVGDGTLYKKIIFKSNIVKLQLTIKTEQLSLVDIVFSFKPPTNTPFDYFLKVSSHVKSSTLFHDSNGYLVSKRILNERPDYSHNIRQQDIINGNTYPVTSFAYLVSNNQKMIFFSDRAQGVSAYNESLLINFDRLAYDDGKGVGEGYLKTVSNTFHYKLGVVSARDDMQRLWQREYDQVSIGFVNSQIQANQENMQNEDRKLKYLKYTIFYLNQNEIVLRLINLAEFDSISIIRYNLTDHGGSFSIPPLGLDLQFKDIAQSYANGIPKEKPQQGEQLWRKYWGSHNNDEINILNQGTKDSEALLVLRPLQIRSFRINFGQKIKRSAHKENIKMNGLLQQKMLQIHSTRFQMRKKCF